MYNDFMNADDWLSWCVEYVPLTLR
jgi:hypothetical protein